MSKFVLLIAIVVGVFFTGTVLAQNTTQKASEPVSALDKNKYKKKEKKGFTVETYVDVKNEGVIKTDASEYSGVYQDENSCNKLTLKAAHDGSVEGNGYDAGDAGKLSYTLKNARIDGGVLTATKVFANGETKTFEAVFVNRTVTSGTNANKIDSRETSYGLGYVERFGTDSTSRYFLEFKK